MSVAGRRVSHELLARVIGPDGPDLDRALRAAVDRSLLVAQPEGYSFRHALLAEAIYDDLLPGERIRWHQAYADVLSSGAAEGTAAELARHAFAANDVATALSAAIARRRRGDDGRRAGRGHRALRDGARPARPARDGRREQASIRSTSRCAPTKPRSPPARCTARWRWSRSSCTSLPADADPQQRALLLQAVASTALLDDTPIDALEFTTEALQLVPDAGPLRARVMATHARANRVRAREEEAWRWATAAADMARELNLPAVLADATTTLARLTPDLEPERAEQAEQSLRTSIAQAREGADVAAELRSSHGLGTLLYELGPAGRGARAPISRPPSVPCGCAGPGRLTAWTAARWPRVVSYILGDWEDVLRLADVSTEHPPSFARAMLGGVGLAVAAGRGETSALALLPRLRPAWEREGFIAVTCGAAAIDLYGDSGDLDARHRGARRGRRAREPALGGFGFPGARTAQRAAAGTARDGGSAGRRG